jgi:hypothetical protein
MGNYNELIVHTFMPSLATKPTGSWKVDCHRLSTPLEASSGDGHILYCFNETIGQHVHDASP